MSDAPIYNLNPQEFWLDPYPDLAAMRALGPVCYVPQLDATLITHRDDIVRCEKNVAVFSSDQPQGLMTVLMGVNMMRKDGRAHMRERKATYPAWSPAAVKTVWAQQFSEIVTARLDAIEGKGAGDLFQDYALPVSADALRAITGLENLSAEDMNRVSQGMIDGCANYAGDADVEANCNRCTALIDRCITERWNTLEANPDHSLLSVQIQAGLSESEIRANIKLAISGGQNEPRDAIAGAIWALLTHQEQLELAVNGDVSWLQVFEEYARWISPIGMSPRRVAQAFDYRGVRFEPEDRVFLMFSSGNRDAASFPDADTFDIRRDISGSLSFGAGPHFCAGAWVSRSLIADHALPKFFERLKGVRLTGEVPFGGWAFRGPLALPCEWG